MIGSISAAKTPSRTSEEEPGRTGALKRTLRFTHHHSTVLVPLSTLWSFASLPLVTAGPATLGAYATVLSLRKTGEVDRGRVLGTIRRNLVLVDDAPEVDPGTGAAEVHGVLS